LPYSSSSSSGGGGGGGGGSSAAVAATATALQRYLALYRVDQKTDCLWELVVEMRVMSKFSKFYLEKENKTCMSVR